ncbi:hypothetical protein GCM10027275_34390 [Rhabdobacter roseus]|uniref:Sensor histidine kinase YesM n=1 Tax=Rhabdobacter roseus TaxID=1655419 RepID=A0A840U0D3_9BACT|nr:histidine kinase [Rhabdobacter roseus]MBB5285339.1 sensor histidine kinase YesM [Rhabdobacter roseus]
MELLFRTAMKIPFNKYVEAGFLLLSLGGFVARYWAIPQITLREHIFHFFVQFAILNLIWTFYYWLDYTLNKILPYEKSTTRRIALQVIIGWGTLKVFMLIVGTFFLVYFVPPDAIQFNKLNLIFIALTAFFGSTLMNVGFIANHFFKRWKENALRAAHLEREKTQVQFDNLKNQVNPHFLFNSLASLDGLIQENPLLARNFLRQLSKVYRYVLQSQEQGVVTLETEVEFVKNYILLLETRFEGALRVSMAIEEKAYERLIVPVTLQVLIENAIKHNTVSTQYPLEIRIRADDRFLYVSNSTLHRQQPDTSNQQGLQNLQALYTYLSKEKVEIVESETNFEVRVPWAEQKERAEQNARLFTTSHYTNMVFKRMKSRL